MVNLELYRVFYTVAKCGSLTKAAEELFISQPAVSQSIKQLEGQLNTVLFKRTHRGMELSPQGGRLIFKKVEEALKLLDGAENDLIELKTTATGTIRIGATDSIFSHILADKIVAFNEKYPAVKFELVTGTSLDTIAQLKEGKCDVGFINLPLDDKDITCSASVAHLSDIFVAGKKFEHLKGEHIQLSNLHQYPLLMMEPHTVARRALERFCDTLGITLTPDIEVANWDLMLKLAKSGMGLGCVPREYCKKQIANGDLFEVNVTPQLPVRGVGIALLKGENISYALKEFINMFNV